MKRTNFFLFALFAILVPQVTHAQILINEFLYDASGTDTDQEYVELYNSGSSSIDLTKWKINDGSNHTFNVPPKNGGTGSISIPADGYVLLVDNASNFLAAHPGISGTVIDTVLSLSNTGATIMLIDDSGATADSVAYTKDQGANGDGNSLQRTGSSWIAAAPTMNAANATVAAPAAQDPASQQATSTSSSSSSSNSNSSTNTTVSSYVAPPSAEVFADGGADRSVIVGADTEFRGRAYNRKQDILDNVRFNWNFGDGSTGEGTSVMHHFDYPGKYVVVLTIAQDISAASDKVIITAEPAKITFAVNPDASVSITNGAGRDIDISHWIIKSFGRTFLFPDDTDILAGQTMRIANARIGFTVGPQTELDYPNGMQAEISSQTPVAVATTTPAQSAPAVATAATIAQPDAKQSEKTADTVQEDTIATSPSDSVPIEVVATDTVTIASSSQVAAAGSVPGNSYLWWLGAFGLALAASGAAYVVKRASKGEWNIIDDSSE